MGRVWSKSNYDHMAFGLHCVRDLTDIGDTVAWRSKKMKYSAIMPHIIGRRLQFDSRNVGHEPADMFGSVPESFAVCIDRNLRNVQHRNVLVTTREKVINQCGFTAPDIDDRCGVVRR